MKARSHKLIYFRILFLAENETTILKFCLHIDTDEQKERLKSCLDDPAKSVQFIYKVDQYKRDWDALTKIADEISSASSFPKTDEVSKCSYCPYRSYCSRGIRAGDAANAESETWAEELFDINFEQIGEIAF